MKKVILLCCLLSAIDALADNLEPISSGEFVILRNSQVILQRDADIINVDLHYVQQYHDRVYDVLCLTLVMGSDRIVSTQGISILQDLHLIDDDRMRDDVKMVLDARLLDQNSRNPSPYEMSTNKDFGDQTFDAER